MPRYSVVLFIEKTYEVDGDDEDDAIKVAQDLHKNDEPPVAEDQDDPVVAEMG